MFGTAPLSRPSPETNRLSPRLPTFLCKIHFIIIMNRWGSDPISPFPLDLQDALGVSVFFFCFPQTTASAQMILGSG